MKIITIILGVFLLLSAVGCKKGANDPSFTLKSRKSRLKGDWKIASATWSVNDTTWTFDGAMLEIKDTAGLIQTLPITMNYSFTDKGVYTYSTETTYPDDYAIEDLQNVVCTATTTGNWNFTGGAGDTKTKSQLLLQTTKTESSCGNQPSNINTVAIEGQTSGFVFNLDKLSDKEIVLKYEEVLTAPGFTITKIGEYILEKE